MKNKYTIIASITALIIAGLCLGTNLVEGATFGQTSVGTTPVNFPNVSTKSASMFTLTENGNVSKLSIYFFGTNVSHMGGTGYGLIYDVTGSEPNSLKGTTNITNIPDNIDQWVDFAFSSPVYLTAGNYYLGIIMATSTNLCTGEGFATTGTNRFNTDTYPADDPFGAGSASTNQKSIYATYTAADSGGTTATTTRPINIGSKITIKSNVIFK